MKNTLLAIVFFLIGLSSILGYRYVRSITRRVPAPQPITINVANSPTPTPFTLEPPSQALSATLSILHKGVKQLTRTADDYQEATDGGKIFLGESIVTDEKGAAVASISGMVTTTLGSNAELAFANLFATNMVLQQKSGKIQYDVEDSGHPVSIRALHSLISIESGSVIINVIDTDMSITVKRGSLKFALVDSNNNTHVWSLTENHRANIDDTNRQVYFTLPR